jgi:ABC-type transporter MlaC component
VGAACAADTTPPAAHQWQTSATAVDTSGPSQLIESSANVILSGIDAHRAEYRKDPTGLYDLVEKTLLPNSTRLTRRSWCSARTA